ncbi:NUDIX hydrolase [Cupriavidus sp. CuC1]|uniref:NUDIX hydrolase n=1 Tax=Cupriavidus sp. CuC1 TaxID=3373131 RepID=UPI0037D3EB8C
MSEIYTFVDVVLLTASDSELQVMLHNRSEAPHPNVLALPGGRIRVDQDLDTEASALRMLREKTGIETPYLEQLYTFSGKFRDPRRWSISVVYCAVVPLDVLAPGIDANCSLHPARNAPRLPFDHNAMIDKAIERLENKSTYSTLPTHLLPEVFTLPELQRMYELVLGRELERKAFRRKIEALEFLELAPKAAARAREVVRSGPPPQYYQVKPGVRLKFRDRML